jgi:hypothetical protein
VALLIGGLLWEAPAAAQADARTDYLVRLLQTSRTFRVRAQAALSLGRLRSFPQIVEALTGALRDEHPAVRTAAASSLEQLGAAEALGALRSARSDRDSTVRSAVSRAIRSLERVARTRPRTEPVPTEPSAADARYYVGVGMPGSSNGDVDRRILGQAREFIETRVRSIDGVVVAPAQESSTQARRVLSRNRLTGYYLDSSIVRVERTGGNTRAVVSVIVGTYPGRDMRVILQGAATVQGGGSGPRADQQAIEGALTGALRRLPQAFAAGDARDGG